MDSLARAGISKKEVTDRLIQEGVKLFAEAFDKLLSAVAQQCRVPVSARINRQGRSLPASEEDAVKASLENWRLTGKVRRLWARDASLWTGDDEAKWLGWLGITEDQTAHGRQFLDLAEEVKAAGFSDVLLLGM